MIERPEYIVVGQFGRPRGVSGEIYLNPISDNPERFKNKGTFWIESGAGWKEIKITAIRFISGRPAVKIDGVEGSDEARPLTNSYLYIKGTELAELPDGKYYHFELIGCRVVDTDGKELGQLTAVETYPANDVWVIETEKGKQNQFPAVKQFVRSVDIVNKLIEINPPEGIFDSPDED
ncbi:MAG: 16S rRNA processing protein RimM [Candidatus Zixiibacteriota bacterium]|nr:MAG: 16S rRNA processing protein RimM [candidate division Zixibacteria bacterium]